MLWDSFHSRPQKGVDYNSRHASLLLPQPKTLTLSQCMLGVVVLPTHTPSHPQMRCCRIAPWITPPQTPSSHPASSRSKPHLPGAASPSKRCRRSRLSLPGRYQTNRAPRGARAPPLPPTARARGPRADGGAGGR